jgi:DNA polymerase-3 subunit alpha
VIGIYLSGHPLDPYKLEVEKLTTHQLSDLADLAQHRNKDIKFAGIVSSVNHRVSKAGKNFGSFVIEDFNGSMELTLFSDDYVNYRKFMEEGYSLYIKGRVQNRWNRQDDWEVKITSIEMLSEIREKYLRTLYIELPLSQVNNTLYDFIVDKTKTFPGNALLNIAITDNSDQNAVNMVSSKFKISLSDELLRMLDAHGIHYRLMKNGA